MKYLKMFESFQMINEEWYPSGPYFGLKGDKGGTIAEVWESGVKVGDFSLRTPVLTFIKGKGDHISQIKDIVEKLYSDKNIENNFDIHGVDDITITGLFIYESNVKGEGEADRISELESFGEIKSGRGGYVVVLNNPIEIVTADDDRKSKLRFHKKLNNLYYSLENGHLENTPEVNELVDKLLSKFKDRSDEEDYEED